VIRKLTLVAGFGAGYVLGAKAGTRRYDHIVAKARDLAGLPAVQKAKATLSDTANQLGDKAMATVHETVAAVADKVTGAADTDVVDLTAPKTRARTTPATARTAPPASRASAPPPGA
jgi:hypothetical protein